MAFRVDSDLLDNLTPFANRAEHAALFEQLTQVDRLDGPIREGGANPEALQGLHIGNHDDVAHCNGSIDSG
jgi:hypothetical protein